MCENLVCLSGDFRGECRVKLLEKIESEKPFGALYLLLQLQPDYFEAVNKYKHQI